MLHNTYIAIVREIMRFNMLKVVRKCSIVLKKNEKKKCDFLKDNN